MAEVVEPLLRKHSVLSSNPNITKKKKNHQKKIVMLNVNFISVKYIHIVSYPFF
jgi:hypothetical protein